MGTSLTRAARILNVVYGLILIVLAVIPSIEPPGIGFSDWLLHAVAYGGFAGLLFLGGFGAAVAIVGAAGFGLATELLQLLIPYRSFHLQDLVADTVGALIAVLFGLIVLKITEVGGQVAE